MRLGRIAFLLLVGCFAGAVMASAPAIAFIGECEVSLSKEQRAEMADKTELTLKDSVEHRDIHFKLRGKTFGELEPGDIVDAHGEPHMLHEVTHRVGWQRYTFMKQSDLDAHNQRLNADRPDRPNGPDRGG